MRTRSLVLQASSRMLLLAVWALVGWGALLIVSAFVNAIDEGSAAAFARLLPARGAAVWGWLAPFSVLLALGAGLVGAALLVTGWRDRRPDDGH